MDLEEMRARLAAARARLVPVADEIRSLADKPTLTDGETERWNRQTTAAERLGVEIDALDDEYRSAVEDALRDGQLGREFGDGATRSAEEVGRHGPELLRTHSSPWRERSRLDSPDEVRSRALRIVERGDEVIDRGVLDDLAPVRSEDRQRLEHVVRNDDGFCEQVIATSNPQYLSAYTHALRGESVLWTEAERSAVREVSRVVASDGELRASLAEGNTGALMVPFFLDPSIILTNAGAENPFRQVCRVVSIGTSAWHGVSSAGVTAEWTAESAQVADATPTLVQPTITPIRADAYVQCTMEQIQDSDIAEQLSKLMADAKDRLESTVFAVGTGSTQPTGIVTALSAVTASRVTSVTTAAYGAVDVFAVDNALPSRHYDNAAVVTSRAAVNATRQFSVGTGALTGAFWATLGQGQPPLLVGHPTYVSSAMTSSVTTSTADVLILGNFHEYVIVDRLGMATLVNPYIVGAAGRPILETGFLAYWRVGGGVTNADAFRMLRLR